MDEEKISLPSWLPWATTACLAALVACLGELWFIEKEKSRMTDDELAIVQTAFKASQNELAAERIVSRREIAELTDSAGGRGPLASSARFLAKGGDPANLSDKRQPWAVAAVDGDGRFAAVLCVGLPAQAPGHDFQVWFDGPAPLPRAAASFHVHEAGAPRLCRIPLAAKDQQITRILVIDGAKGGEATLPRALSAGSIILATPSQSPSISGR